MTQGVPVDETDSTTGGTQGRAHAELLQAAKELIQERGGIDVALGRISMEEVCQRAGLSRSTAYRQWRNRHDFVVDVARSLATPETQDPSPTRLYRELIASRLEDLETPAGRDSLATDLFTLIGEHEIRYASVHSPGLMIVRLATASEAADEAPSCELTSQWEARLVATVDECLHVLGFRWLPGHDSSGFAKTVMAMAHGSVGISCNARTVDAELTQVVAFSVASIFSAHTTPAPKHDARQALAAYLRALAASN